VKLVQFLKQVTANRHHRQHFRFNSTFFLGKLETPSGDNQLLTRRRKRNRRAGQTLRLTASFIAELLGAALFSPRYSRHLYFRFNKVPP
jgi:hypothetical protein